MGLIFNVTGSRIKEFVEEITGGYENHAPFAVSHVGSGRRFVRNRSSYGGKELWLFEEVLFPMTAVSVVSIENLLKNSDLMFIGFLDVPLRIQSKLGVIDNDTDEGEFSKLVESTRRMLGLGLPE